MEKNSSSGLRLPFVVSYGVSVGVVSVFVWCLVGPGLYLAGTSFLYGVFVVFSISCGITFLILLFLKNKEEKDQLRFEREEAERRQEEKKRERINKVRVSLEIAKDLPFKSKRDNFGAETILKSVGFWGKEKVIPDELWAEGISAIYPTLVARTLVTIFRNNIDQSCYDEIRAGLLKLSPKNACEIVAAATAMERSFSEVFRS